MLSILSVNLVLFSSLLFCVETNSLLHKLKWGWVKPHHYQMFAGNKHIHQLFQHDLDCGHPQDPSTPRTPGLMENFFVQHGNGLAENSTVNG